MAVPVFLRLHSPGRWRWRWKLAEAMRSAGAREHAVDWLCTVYLIDDPSVMRDANRRRQQVLDVLGTPNETSGYVGWRAPGRPTHLLTCRTRGIQYEDSRREVMRGAGGDLAGEGGGRVR